MPDKVYRTAIYCRLDIVVKDLSRFSSKLHRRRTLH